ncbi:MAG: hypothetical protein IT447_13375 [Phycisphaerales bacterium]|nr:hypothetical protein [Phycisphaerales bacterium]
MYDRGNPQFVLTLKQDRALSPESFVIELPAANSAVIRGLDKLGILYGAGRFLRDCTFHEQGFSTGLWTGTSRPAKPVRGIYLATHFHNYYHDAPVEQIIEYLEELALWGFNVVQVWFDMHHYTDIDDPKARRMIDRLKRILVGARRIGMRVCLVNLGNEAFADSPVELRADFNTGRSIYRCELCPSKPKARELLLQWFNEVLDAFAEVQPDFIAFGPYDQGGCACGNCAPWGSNGYLKICEAKARLLKSRWPDAKVILSTWLFDLEHDQGEWRGLADVFARGVDWCDYIQADSHTNYPEFPLTQGVPGHLPLLNFPEISMWEMHPWGGFGANPLPSRFQRLWQTVKSEVSGGFPYSEGLFEDINKVLCARFYWDPDRSADSILREYIAYEYSPDVVEEVIEAIDILEANHNHSWYVDWRLCRQIRRPIRFRKDPRRAYELIKQADARLTANARGRWRWRILYLRALIDQELAPYEGYWGNEVCESAFEELTEIYHAQKAETTLAPPTRRARRHLRTSENDFYIKEGIKSGLIDLDSENMPIVGLTDTQDD